MPSYEDLADLVARQARVIEAQAGEIERLKAQCAGIEVLKARVAELEARLGANSQNSSKPPSSDGLAKPAPKSLRRKSGRKRGGQPGRGGRALAQVADPDEVVVHTPESCRGCGRGLGRAEPAGEQRRQVFDIPPVTVRVVEHRLAARRCRCGVVTSPNEPDGVAAPVRYGPRIAAVIVYLYMGQFLSKARTAQAVAELFGVPVSDGTVSAVTGRAAAGLGAVVERIRTRIAASPLAHFDETGFRVEAKTAWLHSASTATDSLLTVHPRRGVAAMNTAGVLPDFTGVAVHDAWAPYDTYTRPTHALCNAHLLRELQAVIDTTDQSGAWCWADQARQALLDLKTAVHDAKTTGQTRLDPATLATQTRLLRTAATIAATDQTTGALAAKHRALARRIRDRITDYTRFATDFTIPFDNNAAEREIRMARLRQKISGTMRTLTGAQHFAAIRSYTATATKHGIPLLDALTQLTTGKPWTPETT